MTAATPPSLPLAGITVVALEQAVAAPLATRHLADLGARVIKVERVGEGDFARHYDGAVHGMASHFVWLNRGKESVALDLKSPDGVAVVRALVGGADVFLQNFAPGAVARLGLDGEALRAADPRLVVVNMSGYGASGPRRDRKAYDMLIQAETGLVSVTGTPETATKTGVPASDIAAGLYATNSVLAALFRRERTGEGATVEVSMFDATAEWLGHQMYMQMYAGRQVPRMGLSHAAIAPYDAFPTRDGQVLIGVQNDRGWQDLVTKVFDRPDLADHPRLRTNVLRVENREECDAVVATETRTWTTAELDDRLAEAGVPAAQLNDMRGLIEHPQLSARDRWREVGTPVGPVRAILPPMTFGDVELAMGDVPGLGEHTAAVLAEFGYRADEIDDLAARGAVGRVDDVTRPTAPPTDAESHEIQLRAQFGLRSDLTYVRTVDADPSSSTDRLGIPLTPDETADIAARTATVSALHAAAQDLDGFGGIWIDQAAGGVIHLARAGTWPEETVQRLRSLVPAGRQLVLDEVAVSLAELDSLLERLADVVASDPAIRPHLAMLEREEHLNTVRLTMLTDTPQETLDRIAQEFGGPGFVLDSAADGGYSPY